MERQKTKGLEKEEILFTSYEQRIKFKYNLTLRFTEFIE